MQRVAIQADPGEERLLEEARGGSAGALGNLLDRYRLELLELADLELGSTIGPKESASDIVQDSLLSAAAEFVEFRGTTADELRGWLRAIVRNRSIDVGRRYRAVEKRDIAREARTGHSAAEIVSADSSPSEQVAVSEASQDLLQAIERLPELQRSIVRLRYGDKSSFARIGEQLGCSPFRARRLWYEALQQLRRELGEHP